MDITKLPIMKNNELSILSFKKEMESLNPSLTLSELNAHRDLHDFKTFEEHALYSRIMRRCVPTDNIDWSK